MSIILTSLRKNCAQLARTICDEYSMAATPGLAADVPAAARLQRRAPPCVVPTGSLACSAMFSTEGRCAVLPAASPAAVPLQAVRYKHCTGSDLPMRIEQSSAKPRFQILLVECAAMVCVRALAGTCGQLSVEQQKWHLRFAGRGEGSEEEAAGNDRRDQPRAHPCTRTCQDCPGGRHRCRATSPCRQACRPSVTAPFTVSHSPVQRQSQPLSASCSMHVGQQVHRDQFEASGLQHAAFVTWWRCRRTCTSVLLWPPSGASVCLCSCGLGMPAHPHGHHRFREPGCWVKGVPMRPDA